MKKLNKISFLMFAFCVVLSFFGCDTTQKPVVVEVTSVEIVPKSITIESGKSATLTATVKPDNATDKTVTWKSSDEKIATVKDGFVNVSRTATANSTVKITATAGTKSAECVVTVVAQNDEGKTDPIDKDNNSDNVTDDKKDNSTDDKNDNTTDDKNDNATDGGKVLNIYCWNDEFQSRFNDYYAKAKPKALEGVSVNFIFNSNEDNNYQNKLDAALFAQATAEADDKIDIFLVEADYALKYINTGFTLDVYKDIGLKEEDTENQFQYTKDVMTSKDGILKGVSWQCCPAGFVYRRSIAKEVLGTDDPAKVQEALSDWSKFDAVAATMKEKGYFMVSGYDDTYRVFSDNMTTPWVSGNKIQIDPQINKWIEQTKEYTDKGYNNKASLWSGDWTAGMKEDGKVFGYFGPGWFIDFAMDRSAAGDWAFCKGPQGFSWGGTWLCAADGTDNVSLIKDIMYTLTCDEATMKKMATEKDDFANNKLAMQEIAVSDYKNDFLGNQNHISFLIDTAESIDKSTMTRYDSGLNEALQTSMYNYFDGKNTLDEAWDNFYKKAKNFYPQLER